jgi:hypothetical protein
MPCAHIGVNAISTRRWGTGGGGGGERTPIPEPAPHCDSSLLLRHGTAENAEQSELLLRIGHNTAGSFSA